MTPLAPYAGVGLAAALAAGLAGSLHCALMCGPLACAPAPPKGRPGRALALFGWHLGRVGAYALVGAALGAVGVGAARALSDRVLPVLPWILVVGLVATALDFGRRFVSIPALGGLARRVASWGLARSPLLRGVALGAATPFLPCGLLWGVFLMAVGAGGSLMGVGILVAFAAGSTPGLAIVQGGAAWAGRWPRAERAFRVVVPLVAAGVVAWRALAIGDPASGGGMHHHH